MADFNTAVTTINAVVTAINTKPINLGQLFINLANGTKELASSLSSVAATAPVYNAVDLGLPSGRKWCDRNVGAKGVTDYGEYFAWGATVGTTKDQSANYAFPSSYNYTLGYPQSGTIPTTLPTDKDAALQNMGAPWRMPTKAEFDELVANTTTTWTTVDGVYGRKVTSKKNSNWIFFPASGYRNGSSVYNVGSDGYYWSSSLNTSNTDYAYNLYFYSGNFYVGNSNRYYGFSVRGVL